MKGHKGSTAIFRAVTVAKLEKGTVILEFIVACGVRLVACSQY